MLSVAEALASVLNHATAPPACSRPLAAALRLVLAEDVASDIDSPPHNKSMVDGYALQRSQLVADQPTELLVVEEVTAGRTPTIELTAGAATRIMTGAPIPVGADAVVMVEQTVMDGDRVRIAANPRLPQSGNIMPQGSSMQQGQRVLAAGSRIGPTEIGLLAEVGRHQVTVFPRPRVAVIATGDELVEPGETLGTGMIRNSNGPMLDALVRHAGAESNGYMVARDNVDSLRQTIQQGLQADVLLLSGGVSAGVLDLAPQVLGECGVEKIFHKVRVKPGKPLWFGCKAHADRPNTLVFGLPGNPVSSLVGFHLFVTAAIEQLSGRLFSGPEPGDLDSFLDARRFESLRLTADFQHHGERPTFHPAWVAPGEDDKRMATPLNWRGSADLCTLAAANALICFPAGERTHAAGELVRGMPI